MIGNDAGSRLRKRLEEPRVLVAPGIYDTLSALLAEQAGFEAVFLSGSGIAATTLGAPDVGLVTLTEIASVLERAADRVSVPIVVDVDSAFGGAAHAARTMRTLERAGAAALQVEDQVQIKPDDALLSRPLISTAEMQDKLRAMLDARQSENTLISARTDATDPGEAIDRCLAYRETGADLVFAEGISDLMVLRELREALGPEVPLVYNNRHPDALALSASGLAEYGISVVLFPALALRSTARALQSAFASLAADPDLNGGGASPISAAAMNDILGSDAFLAEFK